ncbi:MAG: hypothetical protein FJ280_18110 [Planctomycetes bacterium]|nr:hypothetical protein [Planctomycetota bacterium]
MILREQTCVAATTEQVWAVLTDPGLMSLWNPHCVCTAGAGLALRVGLRFQAVMRFRRGPERTLDCDVTECRPGQRLTLRFSGEALPGRAGHMDETFVLQPVHGGTDILHIADFSHAGLPWFLKAIMKVMHRFGRKEGKSPLDGLKELAEGSDA